MAILAFLFRIRIVVLAVLALGTAAAAFFAFHGHAVPVGALFLTAGSLVIAAVIAYLHLRHAGLAAVAALAPLPGMIAASLLARGLGTSELLAIYGLAYLSAVCLGGDLLRAILANDARIDAAQRTLARAAAPIGLVALAAVALAAYLTVGGAPKLGLGAAGMVAAAALCVLAFVPFAASVMPFGEPFFVGANRAREARDGWLRWTTRVVEPRWGLSFSGIVLVGAVLGWFGAWPLVARNASALQLALLGAAALPLFLMGWAVGRDWRGALAATLACAALLLLSLWLRGKASGHLGAGAFVEIGVAAAAAFVPMSFLLQQARHYRRAGDAAAVARLRALEALGVAPYFGALGAAAAIAPWALLHGSIAILAVLFALAGAAAILAAPAIWAALDAVLPRRRSLGQLYGRG